MSPKFENEKVYWRYLSAILRWHEDQYFHPFKITCFKTLYVIGESHSLVSHGLHVQKSGADFVCQAKLIKGCMQWHLGNSARNQFKTQFENIICSIPKSSDVLLTVGEIDCRLDSGILKNKSKFPKKETKDIIKLTIDSFLAYVEDINSQYHHRIIIQGVPCPNIDTIKISEEEITSLIKVIKNFNCELHSRSNKKGFEFLDVYKLTNRGDGFSNSLWHIDHIHLSPEGFLESWRRHASNQ